MIQIMIITIFCFLVGPVFMEMLSEVIRYYRNKSSIARIDRLQKILKKKYGNEE